MFLDRLSENVPQLFSIVVLMTASGFISAGETALFALSRQQLAQFRQSTRLSAQTILRLRDEPAALLSTILIGNTTVCIVLYSILTVTCARLSGGSPALSSILGVLAFVGVLLCAEILPKLLAFVAAPQLAPIVAVPLRVLHGMTAPLRWVLGNLLVEPFARVLSPHPPASADIEAEDLRQLVGISREQDLIDKRENAMLQQLMDLSDARVANLMVPRVDVVAFNLADDRGELIELIKTSRLLRIPVYEENVDNIRGVILSKEFLLNPDRPLAELIRPVHFIPEQAGVEALLQHFRTAGSQLALVVDEYGGLAGVVALEDVVEEIVGELYAPDELYPLPLVRRTDNKTFVIDADLDIDDFSRAFQLTIEETRFNTVGGLIAAELNRIPARGDQISLGSAKLTVTSMRRRRILQALLELAAPPEENSDLERLVATPAPAALLNSVRSSP